MILKNNKFNNYINKSIKRKIGVSYIIIIGLLIIPTIISIVFLQSLVNKYDRLIINIDKANNLTTVVKSELPNEMWSIVAGKIEYKQGKQYEIITKINDTFNYLYLNTKSNDNKKLIEIDKRAMETLINYVDELGIQIENNASVLINERTLENIRDVAALVDDILQDYIYSEINNISIVNNSIKNMTILVMTSLVVLLIITFGFAFIAYSSLQKTISTPIQNLESMASHVAKGNLEIRVEQPRVTELKHLTQSLNIMVERIKGLIETSVKEQQNLQKSEMKALQAQITPHFLYNTFDTIVWLAEANRNKEVVEITLAFTNFFRISLSKGKDWITVVKEVEHVKSYLVIQSYRYGNILEYSIDIQEEFKQYLILKLLLQP